METTSDQRFLGKTSSSNKLDSSQGLPDSEVSSVRLGIGSNPRTKVSTLMEVATAPRLTEVASASLIPSLILAHPHTRQDNKSITCSRDFFIRLILGSNNFHWTPLIDPIQVVFDQRSANWDAFHWERLEISWRR